jgi:hypothetical protein
MAKHPLCPKPNRTSTTHPCIPELLAILLDYHPAESKSGGTQDEFTLQGRRIQCGDLVWLQGWIDENPGWSRKRIARELCRRWDWLDGCGRLKDFAARSLLLKLEGRGQVKLPALRVNYRRARPEAPSLEQWAEPPAWSASLREIAPVRLEKIEAGGAGARRWAFYLQRYHYLGFRVVGENLGYLAADRQGRDVGCLLFGAAAWRCAARDRRLGWSSPGRQERLWSVVNNTRFFNPALGAGATPGQLFAGRGGPAD